MRIGVGYKSFDLNISGQGVGRRAMWGNGQLAIPGYHAKDGAMPQAIAGDYWTEENTDAFYPRAWNLGGSNSGFVMVPQTRSEERRVGKECRYKWVGEAGRESLEGAVEGVNPAG